MVGRSMWDVFPDAGSEFREACLRAWREGKPVTVERFSTVLGVWVESYIYPFENGASVQWRDITERKRVEGALRTTEHRDRSLFENSLDAAILTLGNGRIQAANPAACALFGMTEQEIRSLAEEMLPWHGATQKPSVLRFVVEPVNISEVFREMGGLLQPSISRLVTVRLDLEQDLPPVAADRGQMQQVVTNLVLNASEAIGDRPGTISIQTGVEELGEADKRADPDYADLTPGRYVYLEVRDTGSGMDEATKARLFDPFFTTKFTGRGLGLAAVAGIVRSHGGAVKVATALGEGACFRVLLPVGSRAE